MRSTWIIPTLSLCTLAVNAHFPAANGLRLNDADNAVFARYDASEEDDLVDVIRYLAKRYSEDDEDWTGDLLVARGDEPLDATELKHQKAHTGHVVKQSGSPWQMVAMICQECSFRTERPRIFPRRQRKGKF